MQATIQADTGLGGWFKNANCHWGLLFHQCGGESWQLLGNGIPHPRVPVGG